MAKKRLKISERAKRIKPFYVMEILEKAKKMEAQGIDIVHMEVGEPDFPTPRNIKEAALEAILKDKTYYTSSLGIEELKEKISAYYFEKDRISISPERIIITNGTSGALFLLFSVLLERKSILGLSDPGYPCYRNIATLFDAKILSIAVSEETDFEIRKGHIEDKSNLILVVSNPSNPTGVVYEEETLFELNECILRRGGVLVVDEIYSKLSYTERMKSALCISDEIIIVDGFSKAFAMTGWRIGWMVVPETLVRPIQKVAQNVFISPPSISQYAALHAFDCKEEIEKMISIYRERRDFLVPELIRLGFRIPVIPKGAFYVYANIERWGIDSMTFVEKALEEARVGITPGYDFGEFRAGNHVRFSYAVDTGNLKEGVARLERWLKTLEGGKSYGYYI